MSQEVANFRGFSPQQLSALLQQQPQPAGNAAQQQQPQPAANAPAQPQHNWRYANRNTQAAQPYKQFSNYQTDWQQNRYAPAGNRATKDELAMLISSKEQERANQLAMFEQTWQKQQNGGTSHDHMIREGIWARSPESATANFPWPIHAQPWAVKEEEEFLANLDLVENFLANQKIFYKSELTCLVEGCGCPLQNAEFVDTTNKVAWPVSFIHYLGDHNNPPSRFFFDYVRKAATAIRSMNQ